MEALRGARIVAGLGGADRVVRHINVMEVPDILGWVKEGEFLLTTGFSIKDDPAAQERLIPELAQRGLAGLAIKPRRYLAEIPDFMRAQADRLGFPLVELPMECSFADVISPVMSELLNRQVRVLQQAEEAHQVLTQVVLSGGGLVGLAQTLAELVGNPVMIRNAAAQRIDYAPGADAVPLEELLDGLAADLLGNREPTQLQVSVRGRQITCHTLPIIASGVTYGQISVWETDRPLSGQDQITVERAATVAALEIVTQRSVSEVARQYRNEFLDVLLSGTFESEEAIIARGRAMGWDFTRQYAVLVAEPSGLPDEGRDAGARYLELKNRLLAACRQSVLGADVPMMGEKGRHIVLLADSGGRTGEELRRHLTGLARTAQRAMAQVMPGKIQVAVGVGRFYPGLKGIARGFHEAVRTLSIGRPLMSDGRVLHFEDLGIYRLLCFVQPEQELRDFQADTVGPLLAYDRERNANLVPTLEAYFECGGNLKKVSERLYAHYNTVVYRVNRIEEITGGKLDDASHRLDLELGLKIRRLLPFYEDDPTDR